MDFVTLVSHYYATGEGVTLTIAVAPTRAAAERLYKSRADEFFLQGAEYFEGRPSGEGAAFAHYVPEAVFDQAGRIPGYLYYSQLHYNLS